ncbi:MAG TPA: MFS transporter, partial [Chloroflexota bacterium]|nr:MFS transporter [Chloroflexota bacterium]
MPENPTLPTVPRGEQRRPHPTKDQPREHAGSQREPQGGSQREHARGSQHRQPRGSQTGQQEGSRALTAFEKRSLAVLALPTLGLALAITVVSTYVPVVARHFVSSTVVIGLIVGAEGIAAMFLPIIAGTWSDQLRTRLGGRLPFLLAGAPVAALALVGIGLATSLTIVVVAVLVFFIAYFIAYEPYRALYPDLLDD